MRNKKLKHIENYKDFLIIVYEYSTSYHTWKCGYIVNVQDKNYLYDVPYGAFEDIVNGGITYIEHHLHKVIDNHLVIGWDYMHYWNTNKPTHTKTVVKEARDLIDYLEELNKCDYHLIGKVKL